MVYGFARQSGGTARLASAQAGGTTVTLFLPRSANTTQDAAVDPPAAQPATGAGAGAGILVVEDTELLRDFAVAALSRIGYRPIPVGDGPAALAELDRGQDIALLLSDVVLPGGMTGFDIARAAAQRRPGLPILFMSGFTDQSVIPPDLAARDIKLLRKPFRAAQLAAAVAEALGRTAPG
jgi:CheY-like chemotaxis protein